MHALLQRLNRLVMLGGAIALLALALAPALAHAQDGRLANGCLPPVALTEGTLATMIGGVYVRALPSINAGIVSYSPDRIPVRVLDGPVCANGYNWWQVERQYEEPTFLGWVADAVPGKQFLYPPDAPPPPTCPPALALTPGQAISTYDGVKVREVPSQSGRVITTALPDTSAVVVSTGALCIEGFNWWLVNIPVSGILYQGWIVQDVFIEVEGETAFDTETELYPIINPAPDAAGDPSSIPCGPAAPLQVGALGRLRFAGEPLKNLRVSPTTNSAVIYQLPSGVQLEILSEPFCNQGVNWWQVRVYGGSVQPVGWISEGDNLGRFIGASGEDYDQPAP